MDQLAKRIQETKELLHDPNADWKDYSSLFDKLATAVESRRHTFSHKDTTRLLLVLSVEIGNQLTSHRTKTVKDTCECLLRICNVLGQDFQDIANALLFQIIGTARNSNTAVRQLGSKLLSKLSEVARYDLSLMSRVFAEMTHEKARVLILEQIRIILVYWSDEDVLVWEKDMLEMIRSGLEDQNESVRKTARETLARFSSRSSEDLDRLVDMLSYHSKLGLLREHRESLLAEAVSQKHPELIAKVESKYRNKQDTFQPRGGIRMSRQEKRKQTINIDAPVAVPLKQHESLATYNHDSVSAKVTTIASDAAVMSVTLQGPNSKGVNDEDDVMKDLRGSQMRNGNSQQLEIKSLQPLAPESRAISRSSSSASSEGQRSSISSIEKSALHLLGDQTVQEINVKTSTDRSIGSPINKLEETQESSGLWLSSPACSKETPRGDYDHNLPVQLAKFDEEINSKPLNTRDDFIRMPLTTSSVASTLPSTNNITLRPQREFSIGQDQDLLVQSEDLNKSSPAMTTPAPSQKKIGMSSESISRSSLMVKDTMSDESYAVLTLDKAVDYLTEAGDHIGPINKWESKRLSNTCDSNDDDDLRPSMTTSNDAYSDDGFLSQSIRPAGESGDALLSVEEIDHDEKLVALMKSQYVKPIVNEPEMSKSESSVIDQFSEQEFAEQSDNEDEEAGDAEDELKFKSPTDEALFNLRKDMSRLRETTRLADISRDVSLKSVHVPPLSHAVSTASNSFSLQIAPAMGTVQYPNELAKEPLNLFQSAQADELDRNPLEAAFFDTPERRGSFSIDKQASSKTLEFLKCHGSHFDDEHDGSKDNNKSDYQARKLPPLPFFEQTAAKDYETMSNIPETFMKAQNPRPTFVVGLEMEDQIQESSSADADQTSRFHAAEKLFATNSNAHIYNETGQIPLQQFETLQSPEELPDQQYMHPEHCYPPPVRMGAILDPAYELNTIAECKDAFAEINEEANKNDQDFLKQTLEQAVDETLPLYPSESRYAQPAVLTEAKEKHDVDAASVKTSPTSDGPLQIPLAKKPNRFYSFGKSFFVLLSAIFCIAGLLNASRKMSESYQYHLDLKSRIGNFEAVVAESHAKMLELERNYNIWTEYVRKLAEEDETNAMMQLQSLQTEVQKWKQDMHEDIVKFQQALSVDSIEAAFADLRVNEMETD
ncbi:hypothetical protein CCR75_009078 [Bremia lactucae]|uniref:CLASP N-terminal domain-containing protein n=1 Tax=Bremia lactucae TaxID=4779 RepID=A0A976IE70_BRELC|nr:hypothetical protein CCR75_009078 [Bremia lactucae]